MGVSQNKGPLCPPKIFKGMICGYRGGYIYSSTLKGVYGDIDAVIQRVGIRVAQDWGVGSP